MNNTSQRAVGQTKNVGFEVGARRTFPISVAEVWDFLFSEKGLKIWLGEIDPDNLDIGQVFQTEEGLEGRIRVIKLHSHIRLNWKTKEWENNSTLQIRLIPGRTKTTISFHQEELLDSEQRKQMREYWNRVLDQFSYEFKGGFVQTS